MVSGQDIVVGHMRAELEFDINNGTVGAVGANQERGDGRWKALAPEEGRVAGVGREPDAAHANAGRIFGTDEGWGTGHELAKACRASSKSVGKPGKILEGVVDRWGQAEPVS